MTTRPVEDPKPSPPDVGPHLADLFKSGQSVKIVYPGKPEVDVWIERPNPDQQEECVRKARAARARRYAELTAADSDERLSLHQEVEAMDKESLVQAIMERHTHKLERQAYHDVLYSEDHGSDWGKDGDVWAGSIDSLKERLDEIDAHNKELEAAGAEEGKIDPYEDPDMKRLSEVQENFHKEVAVRKEELEEDKKVEIAQKPIDRLRQDLIEDRVTLECEVAWFAAYKYEQLFRAVRYPNDHERFYFRNATQIRGLPRVVQEQLLEAYEDVDMDMEDLKNSLTPLPS